MTTITRKAGRPSTIPARLVVALNRNGGICVSKFQLGLLVGTQTRYISHHVDRLAERGIVNISDGPRGAHIITLAEMPKRNRNQ